MAADNNVLDMKTSVNHARVYVRDPRKDERVQQLLATYSPQPPASWHCEGIAYVPSSVEFAVKRNNSSASVLRH